MSRWTLSAVIVGRSNLLFAILQPLADDATAAKSRKFVSEACHWVQYIHSISDGLRSRTLPQTSKTCPERTSSSLLLAAAAWSARPVFLMISASCLGARLHRLRDSLLFDKVLREPAEYFISFFFLMGTNCSWQHSGWSNISANVKGLTTNEVWPYQEPGPIHLMADLLSPCATTLPASSVSLAAIFHHWIAHRPCQNSRPCVQFFFSPPSLCILGYSGNRSVCLGQWIGVHLVVCLSIRHSNIVDTQPASVW